MIKHYPNAKDWPANAVALSCAAGVLLTIPGVAIPAFLYTDSLLPRLEEKNQTGS